MQSKPRAGPSSLAPNPNLQCPGNSFLDTVAYTKCLNSFIFFFTQSVFLSFIFDLPFLCSIKVKLNK